MHLILITGMPSVGKTTIVRNLSLELQKRSIKYNGFYTEELRDSKGKRSGFDIVTFDGKRATLSRLSETMKNTTTRNQVGKYAVNVPEFEAVALPAIETHACNLLLLDEIGKMELKSKAFEERLTQITSSVSRGELFLVATIPLKVTFTVIERLKKAKHALFHVTVSNRDQIFRNIHETTLRIIDKKYD
ncbi:nucleoside-triphosphatase THEP1 isoform X2 [Malaya genurostris]|uniref:nucleoside-triphosphatase THEP1 isoform X2 n=1 Tax=Malaya genurostris TaxID=325434 RepID=UPI0026F40024|nr:nucleoside-triphosphatase THEP1 isoform X2 [Malaya genurostris]